MDNYSIYFDLIKSDLQSDWIKPDLFLDNTLSDRVKSAWIIIWSDVLKHNLIGPSVVWLASSKADPVYASTQPSLPSYSAAGKNHYVGGGVGQGGLGVGTGV